MAYQIFVVEASSRGVDRAEGMALPNVCASSPARGRPPLASR